MSARRRREKVKKIKVGIVGAGGIAAGKHLPGHRNVKDKAFVEKHDIL